MVCGHVGKGNDTRFHEDESVFCGTNAVQVSFDVWDEQNVGEIGRQELPEGATCKERALCPFRGTL